MSNLITLRCPDCRRTLQVERDETDYPEAVRLEVRCDKCDDGDFAESFYFDADGNHITRDPDKTNPPAPGGDVEQHMKVLSAMRGSMLSKEERDALDAAIAALSAPKQVADDFTGSIVASVMDLHSVLCDAEGHVCIDGSEHDRTIVQKALNSLMDAATIERAYATLTAPQPEQPAIDLEQL